MVQPEITEKPRAETHKLQSYTVRNPKETCPGDWLLEEASWHLSCYQTCVRHTLGLFSSCVPPGPEYPTGSLRGNHWG